MDFLKSSKEKIFQLGENDFQSFALEVFYKQSTHNPIYNQYLKYLKIDPFQVGSLEEIPFLPIEFFKSHRIVSADFQEKKIFESSGTTTSVNSKHWIEDLTFYQKVSEMIFSSFYGSLENYHILALLPSYLERDNSSLVFMVDYFIKQSGSPYSGFFLNDWSTLRDTLKTLQEDHSKKTLLIGVTFALLELAEKYPMDLSSVIVMETGGMKGRRKEMLREEVHDFLKERLHLSEVHSEYGMTELLSQAYSPGNQVFYLPPWMRVLLRETHDPLCTNLNLKSGAMNIIDLANLHSCAFIATQDLGSLTSDKGFKIQGRLDHSDIRGCNLLYL